MRFIISLLISLLTSAALYAQPGYVGINTTAPSERLEVLDGNIEISGIGFTNSKGLKFSESSNPLYGWIYNGINNRLHLREYFGDSSNVLSISSSGFMGIGSDNPTTLMELSRGNSFQLRINNPLAGGDDWYFGSSDNTWNMSGGKFAISTDGSSGNSAFVIDANKKVGIGTFIPAARMQIDANTGEDPFRVRVNGETKMLIHDNGGVSIGSSNTPVENGLRVENLTGTGNRPVYADALGNLKTAPRRDSIIIGSTSFHMDADTTQQEFLHSIIVGKNGKAYCPLNNLPSGASILSISMNFFDGADFGDARIELVSRQIGVSGGLTDLFFDQNATQIEAILTSIGEQPNWRTSTLTSPGILYDTSNKFYFLNFVMANDENATTQGVWLNGVKIVYEY
jgi:hypothetical protein